jgi:hypothetical protein
MHMLSTISLIAAFCFRFVGTAIHDYWTTVIYRKC